MLAKRIRTALRSWLYRKCCHAEQQEILVLLDRVVQNSQGVLLQLEAACESIPPDSPAKCQVNAALERAEILLDRLREQADIRRLRARARSGASSHGYNHHGTDGR
jgi:hypothetical protein